MSTSETSLPACPSWGGEKTKMGISPFLVENLGEASTYFYISSSPSQGEEDKGDEVTKNMRDMLLIC